MTRGKAIAAAIATVVLVCALTALVALIYLDPTYEPEQSLLSSVPDAFMAFAFAGVGALLILKRPENLVGWSLSLAGIGSLVGGLSSAYGELALLARPEAGLPLGAEVAAVSTGSWTPLMAGVFLLLLVFPAGTFPSPRWRRLATLVLLGFAFVWAVITTAPGHLDPPLDAYENPLAVTSSKVYVAAVFPVIGFCLVCLVLAGVGLVLRFRRSHGQERQQFKWLAASTTALVVSLPFAAAFNYSQIAGGVFSATLIALPVSVGIAVLRYRLYEIDLVINRTLVYGTVTALLAGTYIGLVLLFQLALDPITNGSGLAVALSTLAVAALFRPARTRVQVLVDRRFYRSKYDAQRTLERFAAHLRDEVDLDALRAELTAVVADTMQPAHVSVWLRETP